MFSSQTAAGLIAGMVQSRIHLGEAWDSLGAQDAIILVNGWADAISRGEEEGLEKILWDIENVEKLSGAWKRCDECFRMKIIEVMKTIIGNAA